jgi:hypothetical protein
VHGFDDRIRPINEDRSEVRFVASQELLDKIDEIKGLLAHSHPGIGFAQLIDLLASEYRERHHPEAKARRAEERERKRETEREGGSERRDRSAQPQQSPAAPRVVSTEEDRRRPSASLLRALIRRDGYQCTYMDEKTQKRCGSRYGLEADHFPVPWSRGGKTELSNLSYASGTMLGRRFWHSATRDSPGLGGEPGRKPRP